MATASSWSSTPATTWAPVARMRLSKSTIMTVSRARSSATPSVGASRRLVSVSPTKRSTFSAESTRCWTTSITSLSSFSTRIETPVHAAGFSCRVAQ